MIGYNAYSAVIYIVDKVWIPVNWTRNKTNTYGSSGWYPTLSMMGWTPLLIHNGWWAISTIINHEKPPKTKNSSSNQAWPYQWCYYSVVRVFGRPGFTMVYPPCSSPAASSNPSTTTEQRPGWCDWQAPSASPSGTSQLDLRSTSGRVISWAYHGNIHRDIMKKMGIE